MTKKKRKKDMENKYQNCFSLSLFFLPFFLSFSQIQISNFKPQTNNRQKKEKEKSKKNCKLQKGKKSKRKVCVDNNLQEKLKEIAQQFSNDSTQEKRARKLTLESTI